VNRVSGGATLEGVRRRSPRRTSMPPRRGGGKETQRVYRSDGASTILNNHPPPPYVGDRIPPPRPTEAILAALSASLCRMLDTDFREHNFQALGCIEKRRRAEASLGPDPLFTLFRYGVASGASCTVTLPSSTRFDGFGNNSKVSVQSTSSPGVFMVTKPASSPWVPLSSTMM
jgi:hypothetical protein